MYLQGLEDTGKGEHVFAGTRAVVLKVWYAYH